MPKCSACIAALALWSSPAAFAQHFSCGVVAGTALTNDFSASYQPYDASFGITELPGGKGVIAGPTLEWHFTPKFSAEADGLFRELRFVNLQAGPHNPTVTWEFPILAKYRPLSFSMGGAALRPFIEAGPSFRTTGNLNANPSHVGVSAGAGLEWRIRQFGIAPVVRYTRWQEDSNPYQIRSRPDQIEMLVDFSYFSNSDARPFGTRLSLGVVAGVNLLGDYYSTISTYSDAITGASNIFTSRSGPRSFLIGPEVDVRVSDALAIEADAVYRPVRGRFSTTNTYEGQSSTYSSPTSFTTWQFPLFAKYRLSLPLSEQIFRPFVEAGPSFRTGGSATHAGFTAGGGVAAHWGLLKIAPVIRYTRWQADPFGQLRSNELNLLVGVTF